MAYIWDDLLTPTDEEVIRLSGLGRKRPLGERPCIMVIDMQWNYAGADAPILESLERWPYGCGEKAWRATERIKPLLDVARSAGVPVLYSRQVQQSTLKYSNSINNSLRAGADLLDGSKGTEIVDALAPQEDDIVINKSYASVFYGTPIQSFLVKLKVDTVIFVGGSTSGCVRGSCVDAVMRNYACVVLEDCTFDRIEASHKVALLDLWMKYANVTSSEDAIEYIRALTPAAAGAR